MNNTINIINILLFILIIVIIILKINDNIEKFDICGGICYIDEECSVNMKCIEGKCCV